MKRLGSVIGLLCLLSSSLPAQSSLFWKISGNGLAQPSYLFGTFHLMCKEDFSVTPVLQEAIASSNYFYAELKLDDPGMQSAAMMKMMMPQTSLETLIGTKDYPIVSTKFQELTGMSLKMLDHFKPFMAETLLLPGTVGCKESIQPETEFMAAAKKANVPMRGLETIDDQLNAIDAQPLDSQVHSLVETVTHYDSVKTVMKEMTRVYMLRDVDSLYHFMKSNGTGGDFEVNMLVNRNQKWIPSIEAAIRPATVFFAVGAGHLGGEQGVIALLRKRGYILTPVKY